MDPMEGSLEIPHACYIVQELNKQRLGASALCDCVLISGESRFVVHRGVLAAVCPYFRTKFKDGFSDSSVSEHTLPEVQPDNARTFLDFVYTGILQLSEDSVEDVLCLSDFLCMDDLKVRCGLYLEDLLTINNCLWVKFLADRYSVTSLMQKVIEFMSPAFDAICQQEEAMTLPFDDLVCLLKDEQLNYTQECILWDLVVSWVAWDPDGRSQFLKQLVEYLNPAYVPPESLDAFLVSNHNLAMVMHTDAIKAAVIHEKQIQRDPGDVQDAIVIRSRQRTWEDPVKLMVYLIRTDVWMELDYDREWHGLESIVNHNGTTYALCASHGDLQGYMHASPDQRDLMKLLPGGLVNLPGPQGMRGQCRLVTVLSDLVAVDAHGAVQMLDSTTYTWKSVLTAVCPSPCQFFLPMPFNSTLYLLRGSYTSESELNITLHELDLQAKTARLISETSTTDLNLDPSERFHGYSMTMSTLFVHNEVGRPRIKFHLHSQTWSTLPRRVPYLRCVNEVWGSASCNQRSYDVCRLKGATDSVLIMYDYVTGRYKALAKPLCPLSGVMCLVRMNVQEFVQFGTLVQ
jgi:hypothetical protein